MKTGYYWVKWKPEIMVFSDPAVVFYNHETGNIWMCGSSAPANLDCFEVLSKVERTTSVTVEQLEHEFEAVQVRHDLNPVLRRRSEFPVHRVTIKVDDVTTEIDGIVTGRQIGDSFDRHGFEYVHHADGSVTFQRDVWSSKIAAQHKEEING